MFKKKINYKYENRKTEQKDNYSRQNNYEEIKPKLTHEHYSSKSKINCCNINKNNSLFQEFLCHLPTAILALSISVLFIVFFDGILKEVLSNQAKKIIYNDLFHVSHYFHILLSSFAGFFAFSQGTFFNNFFIRAFFTFSNSFLFCTLADIILPSLGGMLLGYPVSVHLCFFHLQDFINVIFFSFFGIIAAYCLTKGNKDFALVIAQKVHLGHVWIGCIASLLYLLSQISVSWTAEIGFLFITLFFAVVIPCIISDICIPLLLQINFSRKNEFQDVKIEYN